jgi:hypothetical protein
VDHRILLHCDWGLKDFQIVERLDCLLCKRYQGCQESHLSIPHRYYFLKRKFVEKRELPVLLLRFIEIYCIWCLACSIKVINVVIRSDVIFPYNICLWSINNSRWSGWTLRSVKSSFTLYSLWLVHLVFLVIYSPGCSCITYRAWSTGKVLLTCQIWWTVWTLYSC